MPKELSREQNIALAREYVQKNFVDNGMCADLCVHDTGKGNPHFHVMLTMRPIEKDGTWGQKSKTVDGRKIPTVAWNERTKAEEWRKAWADTANATLKRLGMPERIDHRSYERQGVDKVPTIHMGVAAHQMEQRGIRTDKGNRNREIADINAEIRQSKARIRKLKDWIYTRPIDNFPTMVDIAVGKGNAKNFESHWQRIRSLQTQAKVLIFLQENDIFSVEDYTNKVVEMHDQLQTVSADIKSTERRLGTLATHLAHNENRKTHKAIYEKYKALKPKKDTAAMNSLNPFTKKKAIADYETATKKHEAYREKHADAITQYEAARDYFAAVMNGRTELPITKWQTEQQQLFRKRYGLCEHFYTLKDEIKSAETIRHSMEQIMKDEPQRSQPKRTHDEDR
ncbi:MAG: MobA/MobL family protein [Defluviitaleaceae bacterium]|nr:MobA/MobL family protein [Defluviitaleaceae bacterium]